MSDPYEASRELEAVGVEAEEPECEACGHAVSLHEAEYGCDYEKDVPDADIGWRAWRCGCTAVVRGTCGWCGKRYVQCECTTIADWK